MYIKFNPETGRPYRYDTTPDNAQQVAPSNESRTCLLYTSAARGTGSELPQAAGGKGTLTRETADIRDVHTERKSRVLLIAHKMCIRDRVRREEKAAFIGDECFADFFSVLVADRDIL